METGAAGLTAAPVCLKTVGNYSSRRMTPQPIFSPGTKNDDGFSYNILDCKAFVVKGRPGIALVSEQGNHVAGMFRMDGVGRIEMTAGFFERAGAVSVLVDMHSVEIGRILRGNIGKSEYFRFYEDSFVGGAVKLDESA